MTQTSPRSVRNASRYVQKYYAFLLERGYEIVSVEDAFQGWQIVLRRAGLFMTILSTRGEEYVSFRTSTQPPEEWTEIGTVVYAITGETIPNSGNDGPELKKYLDRIESYFEQEYPRDPAGLQAAGRAYRESLPKVEPFIPGEHMEPDAPKEQKIIPILYYPLLAVILLLLFGALTTLYMVLLERLLSAFWPDPDAYMPFIGAGAVLLAIGTLLLFRGRRRKG